MKKIVFVLIAVMLLTACGPQRTEPAYIVDRSKPVSQPEPEVGDILVKTNGKYISLQTEADKMLMGLLSGETPPVGPIHVQEMSYLKLIWEEQKEQTKLLKEINAKLR